MDFRSSILPYRDRLFRLALGITLHSAEAEDVVQDTMLRAWERREEWPNIQSMEGWLTQICRNLALDRKKRMGRTVPLTPTSRIGDSNDKSAKGDSVVAATLITHPVGIEGEGLSILSRLITELPPPQDDIVRLRDIEGLSYSEIATNLNLTETQVRVYLHRARQKIREQYLRIQNFGL